MYFDSISALWDMGGHGFYVWICYAIALVLIVGNIIAPLLSKKIFLKEQLRRLKRERRVAQYGTQTKGESQ